jgi:hypothetical protein
MGKTRSRKSDDKVNVPRDFFQQMMKMNMAMMTAETAKKKREPRKLSDYNKYVSKEMAKSKGSGATVQERFKAAVQSWKEFKKNCDAECVSNLHESYRTISAERKRKAKVAQAEKLVLNDRQRRA